MSNDERDLIGHSDSITEKLYGEPMQIDEIADCFALYGLQKRTTALEALDRDLCGEIDSSPHSLRRRVQLIELRRKMGGIHDALRKAKR